MKRIAFICTGVFSILLTNSCSSTKLKFSILGGTNLGGITENTDLSKVSSIRTPAEADIDAFSGATRAGVNGGFHIATKLGRNDIETGLDYMYNHQVFTYSDAGNMYTGVRKLDVSQFMLPVSYNLILFRNRLINNDIQLKAGYLGQFNFVATIDEGQLPDYSTNVWSHGLTFGISGYPFAFNNGSKLGLYFDLYRGSQIYKDHYNQSTFKMPGSSFMKFGVKYQFK